MKAASRCPSQGVSGMALAQSTSQRGSVQHCFWALAEEIICPPVREVASRHTLKSDHTGGQSRPSESHSINYVSFSLIRL